jgi:hypothetical protein
LSDTLSHHEWRDSWNKVAEPAPVPVVAEVEEPVVVPEPEPEVPAEEPGEE